MVVPKLRFKADDGSDFPELEAKSLFDICEYKNKQSVGKNYVGTENMKQNFSGLESLDEETEMKGVCYCEGDTLMSNIRPYLRKTWKADREGVCSTDVLVFHPIDVVSEYLHYLIASDKFISYVMTGAKGVKMPRGDKEHMMKFSIMVPSLPEQQKIADFLSTIDTIIEKQRATVLAWEERKKGVMQKLFSQEVRFKADDGSDFPDWEEKKLQSIVGKISSGKDKNEEGSAILYGSTGPIGTCANSTYKGRKILIARVGANAGALQYVLEDCGVTDNTLIITDTNSCNFKWLYCNLEYKNIGKMRFGGGQPLVTGTMLHELRMNVPCADEQQKIADCLSALDTVIQKQKETLEKWRELKKGLLQQMFV